jgi:hypothetical protein
VNFGKPTRTRNTTRNLPDIWQTILRGIWLGVQSSLIGSIVFLIVDSLLVSLLDPWIDVLNIGSVDAALLFWFIVFSLAGFVVALVPGAVGGSFIGLVLWVLARRNKQSPKIASVIGIFVGACSGCLAIQIAKLLEPEMVEGSSIEGFVAAILSAALAGLWHSWRFTRWVQMTSLKADEN